MRALLIGDVIGKPGRQALERFVIPLRKELGVDLVVVNCENSAGGLGVTPLVAEEMFKAGADVLTSGNHVWKKPEALQLLKLDHRVLRPANYPAAAPGSGAVVIETLGGQKVGILNIQGRVFMEPTDCPFQAATREVERLRKSTPMIIVDIHAEATSEKVAMGWFLDGKVSCLFGTHTHIPTSDERILPNGTAYLTDVGMTGPYDSVIGRKTEQILEKFLTGLPVKSEVAGGNVQLRALVVDIDPVSGKATRIERLTKSLSESIDGHGRD